VTTGALSNRQAILIGVLPGASTGSGGAREAAWEGTLDG
jgi:hypothetical protein